MSSGSFINEAMQLLRVFNQGRSSDVKLAGMATALLPGVIYILRWPSFEGFDHVDTAHLLLAISCVLVLRGSQRVTSPAEAL